MPRISRKLVSLVLALMLITSGSAFAEAAATTASADTPLVVGYSEFSQKFSPFFSESGYDSDAVAMTQISVLSTDRSGAIVYNAIEGETHPYNGKDYLYTGPADVKVSYDEKADLSTYYIKIRDDMKFSDGVPVTADDLIFSYYVLCDPSYTGSSTVYSYKILGLENYRHNNSLAGTTTVSADEIAAELAAPSDATKAFIADKISALLTSELEWVKGLYGNADYDKYTKEYTVPKDLFVHFYSIDTAYDSTKVEDEAQVLKDIIAQYGSDYKKLAENYGDATYFDADINKFVSNQLMEAKLAKGGDPVPNIEGIKKLSPTEVQITVQGFDAPAVYSICGIQIAPMHYYGDPAQYDYDNNKFGFTRGDLSGIESKTTQPMGAGAYKFIKYENKVVYYEANDLYYKGAPRTKYVQFKETKDAEKISGVGTGVLDISDPSGSVAGFDEIKSYNTSKELTGDAITTSAVDNLGYGYIGINAATVNVGGQADSDASKNLRKALATLLSVYRQVAIDSYYGEVASVINYPISNTSWAAPQKSDADYRIAYSVGVDGKDLYTSDMTQDQKYAAAKDAAIGFLKAAGYTFDEATGKFTAAPEGAKLEYEIIIAGGGTGNHPAFEILKSTQDALAAMGITLTINDPSDANVMWDKLNAGTQEMWVAAWQATIDPDMYQIYHSSNIVGKGGTDSNHYHIADADLDQLIMDARKSPDQSYRKAKYKSALDVILDWGVEIPVYQRQNTIIFSTKRVNIATVTPDITTYWGWASEIEKLEMN